MITHNLQSSFLLGLVTRFAAKAAFAMAIATCMGAHIFAQSITTLNLGSQSRNPDFASLAFTRPIAVGTSLPSTCLVGQLFFNSTAAAGNNIYACTATNTWTGVGSQAAIMLPLSVTNGGTGTATPSLVAGTNITITGTWPNQTITSAGGSATSSNATTIQGVAVSTSAPVNNQALLFNSTNSSYVPSTLYTLQNGMGTTATGSNTLQVNVSMGVRPVTVTTDATLPSDCGGLVTYNNGSAVSVALSQPSLGGNFLSGCPVTVRNYGAGLVTITPASSTVGGNATQTIAQGHACQLVSDGTNWQLGICY